MRACWCGGNANLPFSKDYAACSVCGTLVYQGVPEDQTVQQDAGFYGDAYWTERQVALGHPPVQDRVRQDLVDRNLAWLQTLLGYLAPPARVLEVGCGHGSFVALLEAAGYHAEGIDLSPWIVEFARKTFGVPVRQGRLEDQDYEPESFDCIAWMDVLEHLPDPAGTLRKGLDLLKPGGIFLIQTPVYPGGTPAELEAVRSPFLKMLLPVEHVHLFTEGSVRRFLTGLGLNAVRFHPPIFPYDMFLAAGRGPLPSSGPHLPPTGVSGWLVSGLLDVAAQKKQLQDLLQLLEADHAARLEQIRSLTGLLNEAEIDRAARLAQITSLTSLLNEAETDRAARLEQITSLTGLLNEAETDRAARLAQIVELTDLVEQMRRLSDEEAARDDPD